MQKKCLKFSMSQPNIPSDCSRIVHDWLHISVCAPRTLQAFGNATGRHCCSGACLPGKKKRNPPREKKRKRAH